jgi:iron complex outermembrane receptor protein
MIARNPSHRALLLAGAAMAMTLPGLAFAQGYQVEEVVVTAQKRAERLEDVPISVVAATGAQLDKIGVTNVQDIAQLTVGVNISHLATFVQPTIRGVTSQTGAAGQDNNVAVYVDGVYQATSTALNQDLVSVKSMQVLKGPQGTLFGRNATAGAILIDTLDPSFTFSGKLRAGYGRFNEWTAQGYVTGPLIADTLAADLAIYYRKSDGYIKDIARNVDAAPIENTQFRSKLLFTPTDKFKVTLTGTYNVTDDPSNSTRQVHDHNLVALSVPGTVYATRAYETSHDFQQVTIITTRAASVTAEYDLGWATLKSISSGTNEHMRLTQDNDGTPIPRTYAETRYYYNTVTQEVNLGGSTDKFDWVTGAFYLFQHARSHTRQAVFGTATTIGAVSGGLPGQPVRISEVRSKAAAIFADGTYRLTDKLAIIGGIRYSYEKKTFFNPFPITTTDPAQASTLSPYLPGNEAAKHWTAFTPRLSLRYKVAPDSNVYASFSKGFKSGTYPSTLPLQVNAGQVPAAVWLNRPASPEKITAYEVGFKTAQPRWRLNVAGFYYDYKGLQVLSVATLPPPLVGSSVILTNAANSEIYGVEAEGSFDVTEELTAHAAGAYNHARYKNFANAPATGLCPVTVRTINGVTAPFDATGLVNMTGIGTPCTDATRPGGLAIPDGYNTRNQGLMDRSGAQMLRAPDWTLNLGLDWTHPTSLGTFASTISANYNSSFSVTDLSPVSAADPGYRFKQPSYWMINAQVAYTPAGNDNLTFTVWGKNLANEVVYTYPVATQYGNTYNWNPPMTYGVRVDYKF